MTTQNSQSNEFEDFRIRKIRKSVKKDISGEKRIHKETKHKDKFDGNFGNKKYDPDEWDEDGE